MARYIFQRILLMIPVLLGVTLLIFALQYITPGDPARLVLGDEATEEDIYEWREKNGLNDPFFVQYFKYIYRIVIGGDFGVSWRTGQRISSQVTSRWPTTCLMAILTTSVSVAIGLVLGIFAANKRGTMWDSGARILGMLGISMPNFWFALLLILQFAVRLRWFPVSGFYSVKHWILPASTLGILGSASLMRITRSAMLDNINQDFVRTARAKGQTERVITRHHILRNALIPIITSVGGHFAIGMTGAMILEQIFAIPGLGSLMVLSINNRDYPQLRASVLLVAATVSVVNLLIDIAYAAVDPRVKAAFKGRYNQLKFLNFFKKRKMVSQ